MSDMLQLRKEMKKNKPDFVRQDFQKKSLKKKWRQPKGMHSKLRRKRRGHIPHPSMGYSSPKSVRYLHPSGLRELIVSSPSQLEKIAKDEGIVISSAVGLKKKLILLKKIKELKLPLLNIKNIDEFIMKSEQWLKQKKEEKKKNSEKKKEENQKQAETQKKPKEKKETSREEQEKQQKEEKRKVLEAKQ